MSKKIKTRKPRDRKINLLIDGLPYTLEFRAETTASAKSYRKLAAWLIKAADYLEQRSAK